MDLGLLFPLIAIAVMFVFAIIVVVAAFVAEIKVEATLKARLQDPTYKERVDAFKKMRQEEEELAHELLQNLNWLERWAYEPGRASMIDSLIRKLIDS